MTVGNPTFDHQSHPDLSDLPNATREAQTIAGFYRQANQLLGSQANKSTFEREMERSEVVHFAGHYLPDEASPLRSGLLLAVNDRADNGVFTVQEIKERRFTRPRLIVLSACRSELDRYYNGEGAIGIARGFLGRNTVGRRQSVARRFGGDRAINDCVSSPSDPNGITDDRCSSAGPNESLAQL